VLFGDLELTGAAFTNGTNVLSCRKINPFEVCPRCAKPAYGVYDRRRVRVADAPLRGNRVALEIVKRRFRCRGCGKVFTEPVEGVAKGHRMTRRLHREILWACERFTDLKSVRRHVGCSYSTLYRIYYEQLDLKSRMRRYPWPEKIGIDEHRFKRNPEHGRMEFVTAIADHKGRRLFDVVEGRSKDELTAGLLAIPGRENVRWVSLDLSPTYRSFVRSFFPNARMVADHFHVVRLLHPVINRKRKEITGDERKNPIRKLLLTSAFKLDFFKRAAILRWLAQHPELSELYHAKEALHGFYRIKGRERAAKALTAITDRFGMSRVPEIRALRRTLMGWRHEILAYFETGLTNGRVEGFNGKAKLVRMRAYGYRSFKNYRLRLLNACA
jgi:transposase